MQAEVETIQNMSETLESANFTRTQSDALIQSVALAMKTFAVTPEVLDNRLDNLSRELRREWNQDFKVQKADSDRRFDLLSGSLAEYKNNTNRRLDGLDSRLAIQQASMEEVKQAMHELQRTLQRYFLGFTLAMLVGILGILGTLLAP